MTKVALYMTGVCFAAAALFYCLWRIGAEKRRKQEEEIERLNKALSDSNIQNRRLERTLDIMKKNREETDENIKALHTGDSVSNALDKLQNG